MAQVALQIRLLSARGLREVAPELFARGAVQPYCLCEVMGRDEPSFRTRAVDEGDSPTWDESTEMVIEEGESLIFMVNYKDDGTEDDLIGWAKLEFDKMVPTGFVGELRLTDAAAINKAWPAFLQVEVQPSTASAKPEEAVAQPAVAVASQVADEVQESLSSPENEERSLPPALIQVGASQEIPTENPFGLPKTEPEIQTEVLQEPAVLLPQQADGSPSRPPASASSPGSPESPRDLVELRSPGSPSSASPPAAEAAESPRDSVSSPPRGRSSGAGKPPPPPPKKETPPLLPLPKREALLPAESASFVAGAIDEILSRPRARRPLRQSLAETLEARQSLIDANADDEGRLSSFGRRADEGPRAFGQVLAQAWTGDAGRSPSPSSLLLPWPQPEAPQREVPGLRTLGKALAARVRGLLLHLERTVALDPEVTAGDLLQTQAMIAEAQGAKLQDANLEASGLGKFPPPLMVAGREPQPLSLAVMSSDEEEGSPGKPWPPRNSAREFRSKVRGQTFRPAGQAESADAGFGAHPERRLQALQAKLEEAHGSLSAAFSAMDLDGRGYVSFGDFHAHLVRLHLSHVDAEGSARAMELFKLLDTDADDLLSPRDCLRAFQGAARLAKEKAQSGVQQERLAAFLRKHGLPADMRMPRSKVLGGDQYSRATTLQRYLVSRYGTLYEAVQCMDSGGIGFVSEADFVRSLLKEGYCFSEAEAAELFKSFDPWGKGWLPLQRMLEYEVSGIDWLQPSVNAATSPRTSRSPRTSPRSASGASSPPPLMDRATGPRSRGLSPVGADLQERSAFLFSDPGRLDGPIPASPRRQASMSPKSSRSTSRSQSPVHKRLHVAATGHRRVLSGDPGGALRTAYHNLDQARSLMEEMNKKAKERSAAAMASVEQARQRAAAAKAAAETGAIPDDLQAPGPAERFRSSRPMASETSESLGASPGAKAAVGEVRPASRSSAKPAADRAEEGQATAAASQAQEVAPTPSEPTEEAEKASVSAPSRVAAVKAMTSAATSQAAESSRSALQQRRKAREQRRKEVMKVLDADGAGGAENPELAKVDMNKLDADGDGQISKEELDKAMDWDGDGQGSQSATIFAAVANIFGGEEKQDDQTAEKKEEKKEETMEAKKEEKTEEAREQKLSEASGPRPEEKREVPEEEAKQETEAPAAPRAKALPKAMSVMTKVNFVAGRKGSLAVSSGVDGAALGEVGTSAARKRREARNQKKAAKMPTLQEDAAGDGG